MLKITKKTEYALIALTHIKGSQDLLISSKDISKHYNIPTELMAKTLQLMARVGYIKAVKGSRGGYQSNSDLDKVSLNVVATETESMTTSTATFANFFCSSIDIPNLSKVFFISGSRSSKLFRTGFCFGAE